MHHIGSCLNVYRSDSMQMSTAVIATGQQVDYITPTCSSEIDGCIWHAAIRTSTRTGACRSGRWFRCTCSLLIRSDHPLLIGPGRLSFYCSIVTVAQDMFARSNTTSIMLFELVSCLTMQDMMLGRCLRSSGGEVLLPWRVPKINR